MKTKCTFPPHLAELQILAIETFGSKSKADSWLNKFHPILGNTPIANAESCSGLIEVKKILSAISYGGLFS
ncbi:MAG: MbcA/ParS/Xre antitoxin family protein [Methylotenera sp.]|nr:MbcA/ParS/Xre antitoxin family protein [Methylotenera sp.]MDP2281231.1 MbcA/ParS/Xre antitoxin family protein [Methylotenera sp.]MDP3061326.1 MbcA/ParS/Xre antitoxin family protein [Methylotenera sp.]